MYAGAQTPQGLAPQAWAMLRSDISRMLTSVTNLPRNRARLAEDLLPLCDAAALAGAACIGLAVHLASNASAPAFGAAWAQWSALIWTAVVIGPFLLYDPRFAQALRRHGGAAALRRLGGRMLLLAAVVAVIAYAGHWLGQSTSAWLWWWLLAAMAITASLRVLFARYLQHLNSEAASNPPVADAAPAAVVGETLAVTVLAERPIRRWNAVLKSAKDLLLAVLITILLAPVLLLIALAIRLDSRGPILFRQRRHGLNNGEFDIYKFRTMHVDAVATGTALKQTARNDPRVTRIGGFLRKWSLDELPQLFNVIEGSMSLVGPRPHAVNMRTEAQLGHEITDVYLHRHRVRPGITGWSQVNGCRGATDTVEQLRRRVELDLFYVDHWSLLFDLKILTLTSRVVLRATNAY
jgi:lipopolysaccharide/colanic/teichoic acid biosynthesis glycosyltransferase